LFSVTSVKSNKS